MGEGKVIAGLLEPEVLNVPDTTDSGANEALEDLRDCVEKKVSKLYHIDKESYSAYFYTDRGPNWDGVMKKGENTPLDNFQVHVCKWDDIVNNNVVRPLEYDLWENEETRKRKIRKGTDSAGQLGASLSSRSIWNPDDSSLDKLCVNYFHELFCANGAPLANMGKILHTINDAYKSSHRVVVSMDFYYSRSLLQLGLHKDTTGNTLFVGLHYLNDVKMQGPEYIYDFWSPDINEERHHSPWAVDNLNGDVPYWPPKLVKGLELTRASLHKDYGKTKSLLRTTVMGPRGLITFIDELIFHVTPLTKKRDEDQQESLFQTLSVGGGKFLDIKVTETEKVTSSKKKPMLTRQFSEENMKAGLGKSNTGRRSFIRFWAMVEPKIWHK